MIILATVLSAIGLYVSLYFTLVYYRRAKPDSRWIPNFCRMGEQTCQTIVYSPHARVFGIPNSLLGVAYYVCLIASLNLGSGIPSLWVQIQQIIVWVPVAFGAYLSYVLLFQIRRASLLCFLSHVINLALALISTFT